jgi:pimeloyl-ACP methyl ester carboxylesterase
MKHRKFWFALAGMPLLGLGFFFLNLEPYRPLQPISSEASCRMRVDVIEPIGGQARGYVVLFHGLAANRRIMSYLAQDLANQNLRVFVPDFPGHGRTPGPFSPQRAEDCGQALVKELIERRSLVPEQTLLVGHSMGGAIAIRVGERLPVAGVIAISPAPGRTGKLLSREMLPFPDPAPPPKNSLVISGSWEPEQMRAIAEAMVKDANDASSAFVEIPHATHVSLIFSSGTLGAAREWAKKLLGTDADVIRASHFPLYGFFGGTIGLILLCVPFLAEIVGATAPEERVDDRAGVSPSQVLGQLIVASVIAVVALKFWTPLKFVRVFEGDYLASFMLIAGLILLAWNAGAVAKSWIFSWRRIGGAAFAAIVLVLLFGAWFDYSFYEAWLTGPKWIRLPVMLVAFFSWLLAEEIFLGGYSTVSRMRRVILALAFRSIAWAAIAGALFFLHSGEILMVLFVLYFVLFSLFERLAMDVVRRETQSAAAAAVFGAILSAGFALAIFPLA